MKTLTFTSPVKMIMGAAVLGSLIFTAILASADTVPTITTTIHDGSHNVITSAPIGTGVHANVALASTTGPTVTGNVDFWMYTGTSCTGTASVQTGIALAGGSAESATTTVGASGLSYKVHYNGLTDVYPAIDGLCQPLVATASSVTIVGTLSTTTAVAGTSVGESSVLSGATANATGTVAYNVYTNNSCTALSVGAGTKTVTNSIVPNSDSVAFNNVGTFYWQAVYSGDQFNTVATSSCSQLNILATSTPASTGAGSLGGIVYDDANRNRNRDSGEVGIVGFTINLYKGKGWWGPKGNDPIMTVVSDANGHYSFTNLAPGVYSVEEIKKDGWTQLTSDYNKIVVASTTSLTNLDFGNASTTKKNGDRGEHRGFFKKCGDFFKDFVKHSDNGKHEGDSKGKGKGGGKDD